MDNQFETEWGYPVVLAGISMKRSSKTDNPVRSASKRRKSDITSEGSLCGAGCKTHSEQSRPIFSSPQEVKRNIYVRKWNVLFNRIMSQWISFKPQEGLDVYPCYACRDMFGSKCSFIDHINRRGILLTYKCCDCSPENSLIFYNPCSLLLHVRRHCNTLGGQIDLANLSVGTVPLGLAGFFPHPDVPMIYNTNDVALNGKLNTRFYNPIPQDQGKRIVHLTPTMLLFYYTATTQSCSITLKLKQMISNIPHCKFILARSQKLLLLNDRNHLKRKEENNEMNVSEDTQTKQDPPKGDHLCKVLDTTIQQKTQDKETDNQIVNPASSIKNLDSNFNSCSECKKMQSCSMSVHFINVNKPLNENIKCTICKYIAPSECSLQAHRRIHESAPPFVCPECGKDFSDCELLHDHLDDVCFHLAKQVRYRCPKKNCYKIFAQMNTFSIHFAVHVQALTKCSICSVCFCDYKDYIEHTKTLHDNVIITERIYRCTICKSGSQSFNEGEYLNHINLHCKSRAQCVYVYVCKYCRNFFRSTMTYASHLLRCAKKVTSSADLLKMKKSNTITICGSCNYIIRMVTTISHCPKCGKSFNAPNTLKRSKETKDSDTKTVCVLCQKEVAPKDHLDHIEGKKCRFSHPVVVLNRANLNMLTSEEILPSRKRKNFEDTRTSTLKNRKLHRVSSWSDDLQLEAPVEFNGIYRCRMCSKEYESRTDFHDHIVIHRNISTLYQCMECGECFVVKPSLQKHLCYYHQVTDFEMYMENNECFDKSAVGELREIMNLTPGECMQPVAENQCRVCLSQFKDEFELNKHFRMHGMAFLLQNSK